MKKIKLFEMELGEKKYKYDIELNRIFLFYDFNLCNQL